MRVKMLLGVGFATYAILGNLCMMPIANAMPEDRALALPNMSMMSHEDCDNCSHEEHQSEEKMPCDSGHCLSRHTSDASALSSVTPEMRMPAVSSALLIAVREPILENLPWQCMTEGSPPETGMSTIVLRL